LDLDEILCFLLTIFAAVKVRRGESDEGRDLPVI
jgi:hypothetical protein